MAVLCYVAWASSLVMVSTHCRGWNTFLIGAFEISFTSLGLAVYKTTFSCNYRAKEAEEPDLKCEPDMRESL